MFDALNTIDWHDRAPTFVAALVLGYVVGSIPFGLLFTWAAGAGDVRKIGSGNIGATNVLRTGNRWAAAATLFCDGGKGVATFLGIMLALAWPVGLLAIATWLAVAAVSRISSLSALVAAAATPIYMMLYGASLQAMLALVLTVFIFAFHRENIRRLAAGRETRIGANTRAREQR